jgi:hypothetical protein
MVTPRRRPGEDARGVNPAVLVTFRGGSRAALARETFRAA